MKEYSASKNMDLNRKQKILKLIIEDFVKYAEPVGSEYLIKKYKLPYSSATIRNEIPYPPVIELIQIREEISCCET